MSLGEALGLYLTRVWGHPVTVEHLSRIPGGASRETYGFDAVDPKGRRRLILRRDPPASLIDTDRRVEFLAYASFHPRGVPTPEPVILEEGSDALDRPFFIMTRIDDAAAASPFTLDPYGAHAHDLGRQFFSILGQIAAPDPASLPIAAAARAPDVGVCGLSELDHWERELDKDELHPTPLGRAAIRRLRRRPPPPPHKRSVVHGDYRSGNFLHDGQGRIVAILDWEMAHIGDPLEDLAWAMDPLWGHFDPDRVAGLLPEVQARAHWEQASGLKVDEEALDWWRLFSAFKGLVIWVSAGKEFREGGGIDPVLAFSSLYCGRRHELIIAERLEAALEAAA